MNGATHTTRMTLLTLICAFELEQRLARDLGALGITGYTVTRANGVGIHGPRKYGVLDGANERLEMLLKESLAEKVFALLAANYTGDAVIAFAQGVAAFPRSHFE
jgi:hypothetical protein